MTHARLKKAPVITAVLLAPSASSIGELRSQVGAFRERNVPVIVIGSHADREALRAARVDYTAFFGSSNEEAGRLAAAELLTAAPDARRVLILNGLDDSPASKGERHGFVTSLRDRAPSIAVVERPCAVDPSAARTAVEDFLRTGGAFDAVFAPREEIALGASAAVSSATLGRSVPVVGISSSAPPDPARKVDMPQPTAIVRQSPYDMGRLAVACALDDGCRVSSARDVNVPLRVLRDADRVTPIVLSATPTAPGRD